MTTHTITTDVMVRFSFPGLAEGERETAYPKLDITYSYSPGAAPIIHPADNADPGWPAEIELISATLIDGDGLDPTDEQVKDWAQNWLDDEGYDTACQHAEHAREPDPDAAYDAMRDDKMTGHTRHDDGEW